MQSLNWSQPPLELLVLSACTTAVGSPDAELGFAGLAAIAGVRTVLGSLWAVSDFGSLALMEAFYDQLARTPTRAEALRQAQLALMNGTVRIEANQITTGHGAVPLPAAIAKSVDLRHPFYWSAFTLIGNPW